MRSWSEWKWSNIDRGPNYRLSTKAQFTSASFTPRRGLVVVNKEFNIAKPSDTPKSLSEAIDQLESAGDGKLQDFKNILEKDYAELRKHLDDLKPHLDSLKGKIETEVNKSKNQVEQNVKENPWLALGAVGIVAFILGWIFGQNKKD